MPYGDVFTRINREYYQLTGAERKIADHIMLQRQDCQYMSISELAEAADVAEATVSRFCRRLGYKGYSAFKLAVAGYAAGKPVNPLYGEIAEEDDVSEMCRKLCAVNMESITQTMNLIDPAVITAAGDLLAAAERVLCMGVGGSMVLAEEAAYLFSTVLPNFYAVSDAHCQAIRCAMLTERDVALCYSYSGSAKDLVDVLKIAQERGAKTILITHFPNSPGAACADLVLECGARESPLQMGSVTARMGQLYLTDVLLHEVCRRDMEACHQRRRMAADALADKHM